MTRADLKQAQRDGCRPRRLTATGLCLLRRSPAQSGVNQKRSVSERELSTDLKVCTQLRPTLDPSSTVRSEPFHIAD